MYLRMRRKIPRRHLARLVLFGDRGVRVLLGLGKYDGCGFALY
jgi:hypothetical protein